MVTLELFPSTIMTGLGKLDHMRVSLWRIDYGCSWLLLGRPSPAEGERSSTGEEDGVDFLAAKMAGLRYPSPLCGLKVLYWLR